MTLSQSRSLANLIFNLLIYSLVIKIAILVNKSVLLEIIKPAPGLIKLIVNEPTAAAEPNNISVIINNIYFLMVYISFFNIHYQF